MRRLVLYMIGLLLLACALPAQSVVGLQIKSQKQVTLQFEHITVNEGLSQTTINTIYQDRQGFIWFGSNDGLNRYDGYEMIVYKHDPNDANSLSGNMITTIYEAPSKPDVLWLGTMHNGLIRFDRENGTFTSYPHDPSNPKSLHHSFVTSILEDREGILWVGTWNGLHKFDQKTETFSVYHHELENPGSLSSNDVTSLLEDRHGTLWIGTANQGLNRLDRASGTFVHYKNYPDKKGSLSDNSVRSMIEDPQGNLWIGTSNGLNRFDPKKKTFSRYMHEPKTEGNDYNEGKKYNRVYLNDLGIVESEPHILWVGTAGRGLRRFDTQTGTYTTYKHDPSDPKSLNDNHIRAVLGDRTGVLWVGTGLRGISWSNSSSGTFEHFKHYADNSNSLSENMVWSVIEDRNGFVWVGTNSQGLNRIDRRTGTVKHFKAAPGKRGSLSHNSVRSLLQDRNGTIWVGSFGGVDRYNPETETFTPYFHTEKLAKFQERNVVHALLEDKKGAIWIGSARGLFRVDPHTGKTSRFEHDAKDTGSLSSNIIMTLYEDQAGTLWIGTWNQGLNAFDPTTQRFIRYTHRDDDASSLSHNAVFTLAEDVSGCLWVGTAGGLNRFHADTETFERFTQQNSGLPTNTINGILHGDDGNLWLSTHNGLARFDPLNKKFHTYGVMRGLQSLEFNSGAYFKTQSGELLFGGINGLNAFYPEAIKDNPYPPQVTLTGLKIWNETIEHNDHAALNENISVAKYINLSHDENDVTFDYVGLHYASPEQNSYAYKLDGFDDTWRWVNNRRSAVYTNVPPGDYTFTVKAANSDGVWNEEGASINLIIRPPWWKTGWAYALYLLSLVGMIVTVDRVQRRRVIGKERERSHLREMQLQAQAAEARATALRIENERQTKELEEARHLQLSMLPEKMPEHPTVELAASMKTATEVGGDYYDFHVAKDGQLTIAIGDATGHGANAGTMVTATKALFNVLAHEENPVDMLTRSSDALKRMGFKKLFMALALVRLKGNTVEMAGAGMPPALLYRANTQTVERISLKGIPLGGPGNIGYQKQSLTIGPGDTLILMSDGFPELFRKSSGEMMGYEETVPIFQEVANQSPEHILAYFEETGKNWLRGGLPGDDITFVVMKVKQ